MSSIKDRVMAELQAAYDDGYRHGALGGRGIVVPTRFNEFSGLRFEWWRGYEDGRAAFRAKQEEPSNEQRHGL